MNGKELSILYLAAILMGVSSLFFTTTSGDTEPNDEIAYAETILPMIKYDGQVYGDKIPVEDDWDYYTFAFLPGDRINITTMTLGIVWITLNDGVSDLFYTSSSQYPVIHYQTSSETKGQWLYLGIGANGGGPTDYSIILNITQEDDDGSGTDVSGRLDQAWTIGEGMIDGSLDGTYDEFIRQGYDMVDCYGFIAGPEDQLNIGFTSESSDNSSIALVDWIGVELANITSFDGNNNTLSYYLDSDANDGLYLLKVSQPSTYAEYSIYLDIGIQDEGGSGHDAPSVPEGAPMITSQTYSGRMGGGDPADYYDFTLPSGQISTLSLNSIGNTSITLYDPDNQMIGSSSMMTGLLDPLQIASGNESNSEVYHINVSTDSEAVYQLTLLLDPQNDSGSGFDVNSSFDTGRYAGDTVSGFIGDEDTADIYRIPVRPGMSLNITMFADSLDPVQAFYYDSAGVLSFSMQGYGQNITGGVSYNDFAVVHDGFVAVGPGKGSYMLWIDASLQDDISSGGDAYSGQDYVNATSIQEGEFIGFMDPSGDIRDSYGLDVQKGQTLNVTVDPPGKMKIDLVNSTGNVAGTYESSPPGSPIEISWEADGDGEVVIVLMSPNSYGQYSIKVDISGEPIPEVPSAPVLTRTDVPEKINLVWTVPSNDGGTAILGYKIFRGESEINLVLLATVGPEVLFYSDTDVVFGSTYYYKVAAYNTVGEGVRSKTVLGSPSAPLNDRDNDGMPNDWETDHGLNPDDPKDAIKDSDGDGKTNVQEFVDGTDPQSDEDDVKDGEKLDLSDYLIYGGCCGGALLLLIALAIIVLMVATRKKESNRKEE